jgi:dTDP-D-glucose 4,6-dehydratase
MLKNWMLEKATLLIYSKMEKAASELKWHPKYSFENGLYELVRWYEDIKSAY